MLSESFTLLKALEKASIDLPVVHHRIKDVAKSGGPCLRIRLSANGNVKDVDEITDEEYTNLWFIKATSDAGFPVVRINEPIVAKDSGTRVHKDGKPWAGARAKAEEVMSPAACGRGLKHFILLTRGLNILSPAACGRGLKLMGTVKLKKIHLSPAACGRGLKQIALFYLTFPKYTVKKHD